MRRSAPARPTTPTSRMPDAHHESRSRPGEPPSGDSHAATLEQLRGRIRRLREICFRRLQSARAQCFTSFAFADSARQGIASTALQEMPTCATQSVGLGRVLIARNEMNVGSRKAIEVCGGLLASVRPADQSTATSAVRETRSAAGRQRACRASVDLYAAAHTCHCRARLHGHSRR